MNKVKFCWYSSVCEEDAVWINQYLRESERLDIPFAMYFDRCSKETVTKVLTHKNCLYLFDQEDETKEYDETAKQIVFEEACKRADYVISTDIDETWDKDFYWKFQQYDNKEWDCLKVRFNNLWNDQEHIRVDDYFTSRQPPRAKIYNTQAGRTWVHKYACVQGAYLKDKPTAVEVVTDIDCIHWGYLTKELREAHKAKWDRVYGAHNEKNPYDLWDVMCNEEEFPPTVEKHSLF